jgi:hypothetical protein
MQRERCQSGLIGLISPDSQISRKLFAPQIRIHCTRKSRTGWRRTAVSRSISCDIPAFAGFAFQDAGGHLPTVSSPAASAVDGAVARVGCYNA